MTKKISALLFILILGTWTLVIAATAPPVMLCDFESQPELNSFVTWTTNVALEPISSWSVHGKGAARMRFLTDADFTRTPWFSSDWAKGGLKVGDWACSERFVFTALNRQAKPLKLAVAITDSRGATFEQGFTLPPGKPQTLAVPIAKLAAAGVNTYLIRQLKFSIEPSSMSENPADVLLDYLRLEGGERLAVAAAVEMDKRLPRKPFQRVHFTPRLQDVPKLDTHNTRRIEKVEQIPVAYTADVVVVGGGTAGCIAAVAAARHGARTVIIERQESLGGTSTNGLVPFAYRPHFDGGLVQEFLDRRLALGGPEEYQNPEIQRLVLTRMCLESGVKLLLNSLAVDVVMGGNRIRGVIIANKSGKQAVLGKVIIDSTGDGDIAAKAGAPWQLGRGRDNRTQAMTLCFLLGNVNTYVVPRLGPVVREAFAKARAEGLLDTNWSVDANIDPRIVGEHGVVSVNCMNIPGTSGLDVGGLSYAYLEALRETERLVQVFRKYLPGCEHCQLIETAPMLGVRETRRIIGEYVLDVRDVMRGARFPDGIARGWYPVDVHSPDATGVISGVRPKSPYEIPYRCLVPQKVDGLLMAGRCISVDNLALGSTRIQSTCMALGQAAGTAAALCLKYHVLPRELDGRLVRARLLKDGCNFGDTPDPRDVALLSKGATARADSCLKPEYSAEKLIDGQRTPSWEGRWVSDRTPAPHWVEVTLAKPTKLAKVRVDFFCAPEDCSAIYYPRSFTLEALTPQGWITLLEATNNTKRVVECPAPAQPVSKLKLTLLKPAAGDEIARVMEIEALVP